MTDRTDHLISWLRGAHGMELQAEKMLSAQVERLLNYPTLCARIELHLQETCEQQRMLERTLESLGSEPSALKGMSGKLMAFGQAVGGMMVSDEVVKGAMSGYVFENMEIASYTVLIAAAVAANDVEVQCVCEEILVQEVQMANWLLEHLPELTLAFIERSEAPDVKAKR